METLISLFFAIYPMSAIAVTAPELTPIKAFAQIEPVSDPLPDVLKRIMICESNGNPNARNKYSSAKGLFQFIDGTWKYYGTKLWGEKLSEKDVFNPEHQWELALYVYKVNGTKDWEADPKSKACWQVKDV